MRQWTHSTAPPSPPAARTTGHDRITADEPEVAAAGCLRLRPQYGDTYYAAFVLGPDGHNIEAVTKRAV